MSLLEKIDQALRARFYLRGCQRLGPRIRVMGKARVDTRGGTIILGDRVRIQGTHVPVELVACQGGKLTIGARTYINSGTSICATRAVTIGNNCAIGNYSLIMDSDFHAIGDLDASPPGKPIVIEDDVWIAARVTILKGVTIGRGAVVAAGAVVTRDVEPYTLVGGVPARLIRPLPSVSGAGKEIEKPERVEIVAEQRV